MAFQVKLQDFEDERGYLWEAPDDEGRIRVRDLDGNSVTWYDPGDEGYDEAVARFKAHAEPAFVPELCGERLAVGGTVHVNGKPFTVTGWNGPFSLAPSGASVFDVNVTPTTGQDRGAPHVIPAVPAVEATHG